MLSFSPVAHRQSPQRLIRIIRKSVAAPSSSSPLPTTPWSSSCSTRRPRSRPDPVAATRSRSSRKFQRRPEEAKPAGRADTPGVHLDAPGRSRSVRQTACRIRQRHLHRGVLPETRLFSDYFLTGAAEGHPVWRENPSTCTSKSATSTRMPKSLAAPRGCGDHIATPQTIFGRLGFLPLPQSAAAGVDDSSRTYSYYVGK